MLHQLALWQPVSEQPIGLYVVATTMEAVKLFGQHLLDEPAIALTKFLLLLNFPSGVLCRACRPLSPVGV